MEGNDYLGLISSFSSVSAMMVQLSRGYLLLTAWMFGTQQNTLISKNRFQDLIHQYQIIQIRIDLNWEIDFFKPTAASEWVSVRLSEHGG